MLFIYVYVYSIQVAVITVEMMDLEFQNNCNYDALTLSGSGDTVTLCGDSRNLTKCSYVARGSAHVEFTTDSSVTSGGFHITYTLEDDKDQATANCAKRKYINRNEYLISKYVKKLLTICLRVRMIHIRTSRTNR